MNSVRFVLIILQVDLENCTRGLIFSLDLILPAASTLTTSILNSSLNLPSSLLLTTFSSSASVTTPALYSSTYLSTTLPASSSSPSITPAQSPTQSLVKALQQPSDDCAAVGPQYIAQSNEGMLNQKSTNKVFDVYCNTDFVRGDFMSFYSPSLTTCIKGCVSYNAWQIYNNFPRGLNCSGVTYVTQVVFWDNCFLKAAGTISVMSESASVAYAKLRA